MALTFKYFHRCGRVLLTKSNSWNCYKTYPLGIESLCKYSTCYNFNILTLYQDKYRPTSALSYRNYVSDPKPLEQPPSQQPEKKPGLVKRFKQMARDYWYVLIPVHATTSIIWFGGFYYMVQSGVDVLSALQAIGVSERFLQPIYNSGAGYIALAFACYKVVTPLRYAVTLGGTTYAINRLKSLGWIKPMPTKARIKEVLQEKKENLQDKFNESKEQMKKQAQAMEEMTRYKTSIRHIKEKCKKM